MVSKDNSVYLFIGGDSLSKDIKLKRLKEELLDSGTQEFDLDVLYAKDFNLSGIQEKFLNLPVKAKRRIVVIKQAGRLKDDIKDFILSYVKKPYPHLILILDMERFENRDTFTSSLLRYCQTSRFREEPQANIFDLSRSIGLRKSAASLRILQQLLKRGERPEQILGGLRYTFEKGVSYPLQMKRSLKLLLNCDIEIKIRIIRRAHNALAGNPVSNRRPW